MRSHAGEPFWRRALIVRQRALMTHAPSRSTIRADAASGTVSPRPAGGPIERFTLAGATLQAIRERILSGAYAEGDPLRQDAIAAELGVSRIPVREALRQLEVEGLVTFSPHRGAVVSTLSLKQIRELFELRADIEGDLIVRAVPHMSEEDDDRAEEILDAYEVALQA